MSKYIDRAALFNGLTNAKTVAEVFAAIQDAPAADVQEVCRCEHCFKSMEHPNGRWCKIHQSVVQNSDYCCWGVRKDG